MSTTSQEGDVLTLPLEIWKQSWESHVPWVMKLVSSRADIQSRSAFLQSICLSHHWEVSLFTGPGQSGNICGVASPRHREYLNEWAVTLQGWLPLPYLYQKYHAFVLLERFEKLNAPHQNTLYSFPRAALKKYPKLGGLKQQKFITSFWRPEIQNHGVAGPCSLWQG